MHAYMVMHNQQDELSYIHYFRFIYIEDTKDINIL